MVEVTREQIEEFISKTDFDFSTVSGWREFLNERQEGGAGRDADGFHARDIKNYAVGIATIITNGGPVTVRVNIRTMGSGLALPPGNLYVFHPDQSWKYKVSSFYVGPPGSSIDFSFQAGGAMTNEPSWGTLYYIVVKSADLPGGGAARIALNQYLREASRLLRRGTKFLSRGEAVYSVTITIGSQVERDNILRQEILSPEGQDRFEDFINSARQAISGGN